MIAQLHLWIILVTLLDIFFRVERRSNWEWYGFSGANVGYTRLMTTLKAHFDGQVLVPDQSVDLPIGFPLEITIRPLALAVPRSATLELIKQWESEDEAISPQQKDEEERVFDAIERKGIARVRV